MQISKQKPRQAKETKDKCTDVGACMIMTQEHHRSQCAWSREVEQGRARDSGGWGNHSAIIQVSMVAAWIRVVAVDLVKKENGK